MIGDAALTAGARFCFEPVDQIDDGVEAAACAVADAGFGDLYKAQRQPSPITEAACWAHARRKFFVLADIRAKARGKKPVVLSPLAAEAVRKIDAVFGAERPINGAAADVRLAVRTEHVALLVKSLEIWMRDERPRLSRHDPVAKAMDYILTRWDAFIAFLQDGRICMTNNAAERALRSCAIVRKVWLFAGSDRGGDRTAIMYTLTQTAKMNGVDPERWLAHVLAKIGDTKITELDRLLP